MRGDPLRLRQVLLNLVGNTNKFTDRGHVELRLKTQNLPGTARARPFFEHEDSGIGIGSDDCARLFSPFAQARPASTQARGGTGLGLAIAQRLVVAMGGQIGVRSTIGRGSNFHFELELPLADAQAAAPAEPVLPPQALMQGRVLVVEDNPVNRMIACEMLRRLGLEVEEVENGLLAVEALRRQGADLVLMDYQMPVLDGPGATARIRAGDAGPARARVPIIAVTAHALKGDAEACLAAGMDDYLAKPFSQEELSRMLARWLLQSAAAAGASSSTSSG